ncbi:MAG: hypothetical protein L0G23_06305 [Ruaniaceae bacterium]|nr:hypothetical protein [Ruaniaceae bacterium]
MKLIKALAALTLALSLAACAEDPVPTPSPDPGPAVPEAVINGEQLEGILASVQETLAAADAESNSEELSGRVTGPAGRLRAAEFALSVITEEPVPALSTEPQLAIVAATDGWPRTVMVVTAIPEGENLPLLLTLVQEDPRAHYELRSWVRLLPGTELPQTVSAAVGSPSVPADSADLLVTPTDVLTQYADVMNNEDASEYVASFAADSFRQYVATQVTDLNDAVSDAGEASMETSAAVDDGVMALETYDGGAIVVGVLTSDLRVEKTVPRGTLTVGTVLAYGGDATITVDTPLTAHYLTTIAFYVPPAGSDQLITVLGAEYVLEDVTRGDTAEEEDNE